MPILIKHVASGNPDQFRCWQSYAAPGLEIPLMHARKRLTGAPASGLTHRYLRSTIKILAVEISGTFMAVVTVTEGMFRPD